MAANLIAGLGLEGVSMMSDMKRAVVFLLVSLVGGAKPIADVDSKAAMTREDFMVPLMVM